MRHLFFIIITTVCAFYAPAAHSQSAMSYTENLIIPAPLTPGAKIAIISPAGQAKKNNVTDAMKVLEAQGWRPYLAPHAMGEYGSFSGSAEQRFADFSQAWLDDSTQAIICSRGGYGAVHLLDWIDALALRSKPKWLVGFSDISALHALLSNQGIASVHGPMAKHISANGGDNDDFRALVDILTGRGVDYSFDSHPFNRYGEATGPLCGGNLSVIADLIATPYDAIRPGSILLIEDIAEPVYKIERILYQLRMSGAFDKIAGLIVGEFTDYKPDVNHKSMESMIAKAVEGYDFPVAYGITVGHDERNLPLIISAPLTLTVTPEGTRIIQK